MKIPTSIKKYYFSVSFILATVLLSAQLSFGQCCAKVKSTKACKDYNNGTATITPCAADNYTYKWDDASAQTGPVAVGLSAGIYHVVISYAGVTCPAIQVVIEDSICNNYIIPNILTPNGDGINDSFVIKGLETGAKLTVFNRWGTIVYSNNDYNNDWTPSNLADGIYFYTLVIPSLENISVKKNDPSKGFIHILSGK